MVGEAIPADWFYDAVNVILSLQVSLLGLIYIRLIYTFIYPSMNHPYTYNYLRLQGFLPT
jgi:cycloartenol synthase